MFIERLTFKISNMESKVVEIWLRKGGGSDCTFCLSSGVQVPSHHEQRVSL